MDKKYSIALDIGTNSVGWSVIDRNYSLIRYKKQNMWGSRLFESGETAKQRRIFRGTRRRLSRRKERIRLLRSFMEKDIFSIDPTFFIRLEESFLHREDRNNKIDKSNLFIDKGYTDKDFYKEYPTIYHLRESLVKNTEKADLRHIYLAIHHMLKYRGHFLYEGQSFENIVSDIDNLLILLIDNISEIIGIGFNVDIYNIIEILEDKSINRKDKVKKVIELSSNTNDEKKTIKEILNGFIGFKFDVGKIFKGKELGDNGKIVFSDTEIDSKLEVISGLLDEEYVLLENMKKIYSWIKLNDILKGKTYISEAMIAKYEKYGQDLKLLKSMVLDNCSKNEYDSLFRSNEHNIPSYKNFVNNNIKSSGKEKCIDVFYKHIKKLLSHVKEDDNEKRNYILTEIDEERFLVKLNTTENSAIPYQLNENELKSILSNQGKYYECLKENQEKILKILTFRIPYYVGPLTNKSSFGWIEKNKDFENIRVLPWNIQEVVDIDATAEKFITKMTNYCTYLKNEKVLPMYSLIYSDYLFYNEINKIRFNGKFLSREAKEDLRIKCFMQKNNISKKDLEIWYKGYINTSKTPQVEGYQGDEKVNATLKAYRDFTVIYGEINEANIKEIEEIISWITIFKEKSILERKIRKEYKTLSDDQIKKIMSLNYEGWGALSRELLEGIKVGHMDFDKKSIIDILENTNQNFMQIINDDKLGFDKEIKKKSTEDIIDIINYNDHIKTLHGSPAIKRGVWQSIKLIQEIIKIMGEYPENIYLEFARSDEESKRTLPKKEKLIALYKNIEKENEEYKRILNNLSDKSTIVNSEKLYLYYIQHGKCMYTQKPIDIDELNKAEIDHIIPQCYIKDDSISNKALVLKSENQKKSSGKLSNDIIRDRKNWWGYLYKNGFIEAKKYYNLTDISNNFDEKIEKGFINRQLVETRQISRYVTELLISAYGNKRVNVVAIKAQLVDDFRKQFDVYKNREVNCHHHAKDAYITGVLGNYILNRFSKIDSEFIYNKFKRNKKQFVNSKNKYGFIISSMGHDYKNINGEMIWNRDLHISKIKKILGYNDCLVTKKTTFNKGQMFNLTMRKNLNSGEKISKPIPLRSISKENTNKNGEKQIQKFILNPEKYGCYSSIKEAYYAVIEYKKKNKKVKRLVGIPIMHAKSIGNSNEKLIKYLNSEGYSEVKILKNKIPKYQKIVTDKGTFYVVSSNEWHNAKQLILTKDQNKFVNELRNKNIDKSNESLSKFYLEFIEKLEKEYPIFLSVAKKLKEEIEKFNCLNVDDKIKVIFELLKITTTNAEKGNLEKLKLSKELGKLNSKSETDMDKVGFIYESVTGLMKKEVKY